MKRVNYESILLFISFYIKKVILLVKHLYYALFSGDFPFFLKYCIWPIVQ
jgi:hypothetical protein